MNQIAAIRIFAKVAECLNFTEAAKQLDVSSSVVTGSVALLEQHLGVRLINRTTRRVSLTPVGERYQEHCSELLRQLSVMDQCIATATGQPAGSLRVAATSSYAMTGLPELLVQYRLHEPRTQVELTVFDTMADVSESGFDVCYSAERRLRDSSMVCRPLAHVRDAIVASPSYLERRSVPSSPADLAGHDVLLSSDAPGRYWEFNDKHGTQRVIVRPIINAQSPLLVKQAVRAGMGIARLPRSIIENELADGSLKALLAHSELQDDERTLWLLYSGQPHMAPAIRRFIDFVVERYRQCGMYGKQDSLISVRAIQHQSSNTELMLNRIL